jgi:hypothetical protein
MKSKKQTKDPIAALKKAMEKCVLMTSTIYARDGPIVPFGHEHLHFILTVFYDRLLYGLKWSSIAIAMDMRSMKSWNLL